MPFRPVLFSLMAALALGACNRHEVHTYRVPKETATPAPSLEAPSAVAPPPGFLSWQAPDHWEEQPAGGMRRGSFTLRGENGASADLSVIAFPGDAGGLAANINRWRGQVGLAELSLSEAEATVEHVDSPTFHLDFVNMIGETSRIEGAILSFGGESWFFKLMGSHSLVAQEAANFRAFMMTVAPRSTEHERTP